MSDLSNKDLETIGGRGARNVDDLLGDGFVGHQEISGNFIDEAAQEALVRGGEVEEEIVAGAAGPSRQSKSAAKRLARRARPAFRKVGFVRGDGFVGSERSDAEFKKAESLRRAILSKTKPGVEIPASEVDAFVGALNRAYALANVVPATTEQTQSWKGKLLGEIADLGGKVRGTTVSGMGDWLKTLGQGIGKAGEFTARVAVSAPKAILWDAPKTMLYNPAKKTFFPGGGGSNKSASRPGLTRMNPPPPDQYEPDNDVRAYAQRIAVQQSDVQARRQALQSRLSLARAKQSLAQAESQDEVDLANLEAQAATAEAEAAQMESSSGGDSAALIAGLKNRAVSARLAGAVLKSTGPYARHVVSDTPSGKAYAWTRQLYREAKADADGADKVAKLKVKADAGDARAKAAMRALAIGKKTDEEMTAANIANKQLQDAALRGTGAAAVVGLLPSSGRVIEGGPEAQKIYDLACQGNPAAVQSVRKCGDLLRRASRGDASARNTIKKLRAAAAGGNAQARLHMNSIAVASAGLREGKYVAKMTGEFRRGRRASIRGEEKKAAAKKMDAKAAAAKKIASTFGPTGLLASSLQKLTGTERYAKGLDIKLAMHK